MSHPFTKIFEKALKKSTVDENLVFDEAIKLRKKGYSVSEIRSVLDKLQKSLSDESEEKIVGEALLDFVENE